MRLTAATLPGGKRNQDVHAVLANAAVVLDGASSFAPGKDERDGGWYATRLLTELAPRVADASMPLSQCLRQAIAAMRDKQGATIGGPSSTVLIARWTASDLHLLVLGDSCAVIQHPDGRCEAITDGRLALVNPEVRRQYRSRLAAGGTMDDEHRAQLAALQTSQRRHRNRARGYWIAEADPDAADKALTKTVALADIERLLLATDGATAAVEDYRRWGNWNDYLTSIRSSPGQTLGITHRLEETDPDGQRWPRAKRHDDKTLVLIET